MTAPVVDCTAMTVDDAAKLLGLSARRVQELCHQGRIPGARLVGGRIWIIPNRPVITPGTRGPKPTYRQ